MALLLPSLQARSDEQGRELLLDVIVNGRHIGKIGTFHEQAGALSASRDELAALGFRISSADQGSAEVALSRLLGLTYQLDEQAQSIVVSAPFALLQPTQLGPEPARRSVTQPVESGTGAVMNYDVVGTQTSRQLLAQGVFDGRLFSPYGLLAHSVLATEGGFSLKPVVRLDTTYTFSDVEKLWRYRAGDVIAGSLPWTRATRLGGIQFTSDFALQPDLVTFPVPMVFGEVAVPSSVDVLVNNVRLLGAEVAPGPFQVRGLPVITGTGDVSVTIRDAVGQETRRTLPFYASTLLLAKGLSAFSGEFGAVRLNYGLRSNDYRAPAASASYRYGLFDWLTLDGHGEWVAEHSDVASRKIAGGGLAGGGLAVSMARLGVVTLDGAGSQFGGRSGALVSIGLERLGQTLSLAGSVQATTRDFQDIASAFGDGVARWQVRGSIGLNLPKMGSLGLAYVGYRRQRQLPANSLLLTSARTAELQPNGYLLGPVADRASIVSASYSRQVLGGSAYLYVNGYHDLSSSSNYGLLAGLTFPIGNRSSGDASVGSGRNQSYVGFTARQSAAAVGDVGWQAQELSGRPSRQLITGEYKSPWALLGAGAEQSGTRTAFRGSIDGALAYAGGSVFASNRLYDSFAVIDTEGAEDVQILQENRVVGRTGRSGMLLVPNLRSFEANRLGINPADIPADSEIGATSRLVQPQDRSGIVVRFPVRPSHGALLSLVDSAGRALPVGSIIQLEAPQPSPPVSVGYDGEAYLSGLQPNNRLKTSLPNGDSCSSEFHYVAVAKQIPRIGPVVCR